MHIEFHNYFFEFTEAVLEKDVLCGPSEPNESIFIFSGGLKKLITEKKIRKTNKF